MLGLLKTYFLCCNVLRVLSTLCFLVKHPSRKRVNWQLFKRIMMFVELHFP
uniref:Uncharacterized protein n=1 Tax=Anguilla anguilla TaxID=7936 RepID=A0A0E9XRC1_ANGAN